jgi:hypothetical protein
MYHQRMELLPKHETRPQHTDNTPVVPVSTPAIQMWIEFAQLQSMEEIMVEIYDGNVAVVEILRDAMRSGIPNDLATWGSIVRTLQDQLMIAAADDDANMETKIDTTMCHILNLQRWYLRARVAVEQLEWLSSYATPIK